MAPIVAKRNDGKSRWISPKPESPHGGSSGMVTVLIPSNKIGNMTSVASTTSNIITIPNGFRIATPTLPIRPVIKSENCEEIEEIDTSDATQPKLSLPTNQVPVCGNNKGHLILHKKDVLNMIPQFAKPPFTCDICQKSFSEKCNLKRHLLSIHIGNYL